MSKAVMTTVVTLKGRERFGFFCILILQSIWVIALNTNATSGTFTSTCCKLLCEFRKP